MTWRDRCEATDLCRPCQAPFPIQFDLAGSCFEARCLEVGRPDGSTCGCEVIRLLRQGPCRTFVEPGYVPTAPAPAATVFQTAGTAVSSAWQGVKGALNWVASHLHVVILAVVAIYLLMNISDGD